MTPEIEKAVGAALLDPRASTPRIPLGRAVAITNPLVARLRSRPEIEAVSTAGSLRRGQETVGDIRIIAACVDPTAAMDDLAHAPGLRLLQRSGRRLCVRTEREEVGVLFVNPSCAGSSLLHLTGSHAHLEGLRVLAHERGYQLQPSGLIPTDRDAAAIARSEEDIYAELGLPFIPPELREGGGEIEAARLGGLPALVAGSDIRGDLHMHSTWSDGADSVEAMVNTCRGFGYEYVAITDHSPHSQASRNLSLDDVGRQAEEIARLRDRYPDIGILHGCEVESLPDGSLDFPDRVLERFDFVIASVHERGGQEPAQLQERYLRAMRHPLVTLLAHPTNRFVPDQAGYDLDYDRLFAAAVETSTLLEINGSPAHLDLPAPLARRAIAAGALVAVSSDSHRASVLRSNMELGVTTARSGWVGRRHVVNTLPLCAVRAILARKRSVGSR
jgi:DNA polymerase (family X)